MIIKNGYVFSEEGVFEKKDLYIEDGKVAPGDGGVGPLTPGDEVTGSLTKVDGISNPLIDATDCYVIPGLIDIHLHGCAGYDFCDGTKESLSQMAAYELQNGITSFCPTSMTLPEETLARIFANAALYAEQNETGARMFGIRMEGPFISDEKKGAQNGSFIHKPDIEMFMRLQEKAKQRIKLVDIAPEVEGAMECIEALSSLVRVSIAHTNADYDTAKKAFEKGASQVTHLYNAMPEFMHRAPGVVGAACDDENVMVELICDGVHCHPATIRASFKMFGDHRIIFISDSMMACGLEDGQYTLGGQAVTVCGNLATLTKDGNLAGSVTNLMDCVRTAVKEMGIPLASAIKCATINPAKALGIAHQYGSLTPGKIADVVILDQNLEIVSVIQAGNLIAIE